MVPLYSLSIEHVNFNVWKWNFDRFSLIDCSILSVNCSHLCSIYVKIFEKILSGGLEVSFSISGWSVKCINNISLLIIRKRHHKVSLKSNPAAVNTGCPQHPQKMGRGQAYNHITLIPSALNWVKSKSYFWTDIHNAACCPLQILICSQCSVYCRANREWQWRNILFRIDK